ncbi:MAG: toxin-antitoxin system YwqK family antitoxin [Vicingaceae bacterium]
MKTSKIIQLIIALFFISCNTESIDNDIKRNDNWVWFEDDIKNEGRWVPVTETMGINTGNYTEFYSTGEVRKEGKIKNYKHIDTAYGYNKLGDLIKKQVINEGQVDFEIYMINGPYKEFYSTGELLATGSVQKNKRFGLWKNYYKNGHLRWTENYINKTGSCVNYYESGSIKDSVYYIKNKQNGTLKLWYENGKISQITNWKDNLQHGNQYYYYDNGQLRGKEFWVFGKIEGNSIHFYSNGNMKHEHSFKNGIKNGLQKQFSENGNLKSVGNLENGLQVGEWEFYTNSGKLYQLDTYMNGELINIKEY